MPFKYRYRFQKSYISQISTPHSYKCRGWDMLQIYTYTFSLLFKMTI